MDGVEMNAVDGKTQRVLLDLSELEKAIVVYDSVTNTLHIILSNEEADETILLENNIVVRICRGRVIGISIQEVLKSS